MEWSTRTRLDRSLTQFWLERINLKNSQTNFLEEKINHLKPSGPHQNKNFKGRINVLILKKLKRYPNNS